MKIGMTPKQREIWLIPVPFSDLSAQKRRPVIVLSSDNYNENSSDFVVVAMTSNPRSDLFSFMITSEDLAEGDLRRPSVIRADKIFSLAQSEALKRFGKVDHPTFVRILQRIAALMRSSKNDN